MSLAPLPSRARTMARSLPKASRCDSPWFFRPVEGPNVLRLLRFGVIPAAYWSPTWLAGLLRTAFIVQRWSE